MKNKVIILLIFMVMVFSSCTKNGGDYTIKADAEFLTDLSYSKYTINDVYMYVMPADFTGRFSHINTVTSIKNSLDKLYFAKISDKTVAVIRLAEPEAYGFLLFDAQDNLVDGMYFTRLFKKADFEKIAKNQSKLNDVKEIDPNTYLISVDGSNDSESYHWLRDGNVIRFSYDNSDMSVKDISVIQSEVFAFIPSEWIRTLDDSKPLK